MHMCASFLGGKNRGRVLPGYTIALIWMIASRLRPYLLQFAGEHLIEISLSKETRGYWGGARTLWGCRLISLCYLKMLVHILWHPQCSKGDYWLICKIIWKELVNWGKPKELDCQCIVTLWDIPFCPTPLLLLILHLVWLSLFSFYLCPFVFKL